MGQWELLARLLVGTLFGTIIGYERQLHGRPDSAHICLSAWHRRPS